MWGYFSRGPDFPYTLGEQLQTTENSVWELYKGKKKKSEEEVSIFTFDFKQSGSSSSLAELARSAFRRVKTIRHPCVIPFLDGYESDERLCIVTEPVVPLEQWLRENRTNRHEAISWGLHQISKGLSFLINDVAIVHNGVCISAVYVDNAGEWRLGGLDYAYSVKDGGTAPVKMHSSLKKYEPPRECSSLVSKKFPWYADMWGLGCLIWEAFNGRLTDITDLKSLSSIPKSLVTSYAAIMGADPKTRPSPNDFINNCREPGKFMSNKYVDAMLFLDEIQIKEPGEKQQFFSDLTSSLDTFPEQSCRFRILPKLLDAHEFANAGAFILPPLLKLGKLLDTDEYQKKIIPCIVKLFQSPDRNTRVKLLQQIDIFVEYLTPNVVNEQIFPHLVKGFVDTNPVVREYTIKSMLNLAPKLNYKNLNEDLLRQFARLQQKDEQGGIRTNTTICLGKIACYLHPPSRQKVLISAMQRALKDPFPDARQAAALALAATNHLFTCQESATRVLPMLCATTVDPNKAVRDQAFNAMKCYIDKLSRVSDDPSTLEDIEKDVLSGAGQGHTGTAEMLTGGWAGWAVSGVSNITSKLYKNSKDTAKDTSPVKSSSSPDSKASTTDISTSSKPAHIPAPKLRKDTPSTDYRTSNHSDAATTPDNEALSNWDDDGDDGWGDIEVSTSKDKHDWSSTNTTSSNTTSSNTTTTGYNKTNTKSPMEYSNYNNDHSFSDTLKPQIVNKTDNASKTGSNDWSSIDNDDWSNSWGEAVPKNDSKKDAKKLERQRIMEEKRAARKLKQGDGAMKLGSKKNTF